MEFLCSGGVANYRILPALFAKGPLIGLSKSKCLPFLRNLPRSSSTIGAGTRVIRLQVIEGPNAHDQVTFCALHSFLMELKRILAIQVLHKCNSNQEIIIAGSLVARN